jgi:hypothetical protein
MEYLADVMSALNTVAGLHYVTKQTSSSHHTHTQGNIVGAEITLEHNIDIQGVKLVSKEF